MKFPLRISSVNVTKSVTFNEEILNGKLHFLCSESFFYKLFVSIQRKLLLEMQAPKNWAKSLKSTFQVIHLCSKVACKNEPF